MKGDTMAKRSSFGSIVRKRLSDITNSIPQPKSPTHHQNPSPIASSAKDQIDHLLKENMALMKIIADKNKIIELSGIELQKFRVNIQKIQLQNWNLARSNSQLLAELNLGKEKLLRLQHELMCKEALLKVKNSEHEDKLKMKSQKDGSQLDKEIKNEKPTDDNKPCNGTRRRPLRSQSLGTSSTSNQLADKEIGENKRRCLRRQSARFKSQEEPPKDDLFEIEDAKFSSGGGAHNTPMHEDGSTLIGSSVEEEENDENSNPKSKPQDSRCSIGRPVRRAAEKVQTYKEIPLNIKMRRSE